MLANNSKTGLLLTGLITAFTLIGTQNTLAQEEQLVWSFSKDGNAASGSASLSYGVPETDNIQVYATCGVDSPSNSSSFLIGADIGNLNSGDETKVRFSGSGKEYEVSGKVYKPQSEEGIYGVKLNISNDDPIWDAFTTNDGFGYQIPGYIGNQLPLAEGHEEIKNFIAACRSLSSQTSESSTAQSTSDSGLSQSEAFKFAKDINTIEGFNAFLKSYPSGFFADLARAHLAKMQKTSNAQQPTTAAPSQPSTPPPAPPVTNFSYLDLGPGNAPWFNSNYNNANSAYSANVTGTGTEFLLFCTPNRNVSFAVRKSGNELPSYSDRVKQALGQSTNVQLSFSDGGNYNHSMVLYDSNSGEFGSQSPVSADVNLISSLVKDDEFTLRSGTFGATYQLKGSRVAICNVLDRCGANAPVCNRAAPRPAAEAPPARQGNCRARSVYIEGRGCVLRRHVDQRPRGNGCRRGQVRFDGRCMFKNEIRGYCGPGYTPSRGRCVSQAAQPRRPQNTGPTLKRNNGGTISLAACLAQGMIPEFGYCVEND